MALFFWERVGVLSGKKTSCCVGEAVSIYVTSLTHAHTNFILDFLRTCMETVSMHQQFNLKLTQRMLGFVFLLSFSVSFIILRSKVFYYLLAFFSRETEPVFQSVFSLVKVL